jgi:hypothetical protein
MEMSELPSKADPVHRFLKAVNKLNQRLPVQIVASGLSVGTPSFSF